MDKLYIEKNPVGDFWKLMRARAGTPEIIQTFDNENEAIHAMHRMEEAHGS